jgi:hypothetical protein
MSERHYLYKGTRLRQMLDPATRTLAIGNLFQENPVSGSLRFYTNTERVIDRHSLLDMHKLEHAKRMTRHLAKAAFTLTFPVMVKRCSDETLGDTLRLYFAVAETEELRQLKKAFDHISVGDSVDDNTDDNVPDNSIYTEIAVSSLATPERLDRARHALLREVGDTGQRSFLYVHDPRVVEKDLMDSFDLAS